MADTTYPKYKFKGNESRLVHSKQEEDDLGRGWTDTHEGAEYPKWRYHATQEPRLVSSKDEQDALGGGWGDKPIEKPRPKDVDQVNFQTMLYLRSLGYTKMKSLEDAQQYINTLSPDDRAAFYAKAKAWEDEENKIDEKLQTAKAPKQTAADKKKLDDQKKAADEAKKSGPATPLANQQEGDTSIPQATNARPGPPLQAVKVEKQVTPTNTATVADANTPDQATVAPHDSPKL